MDNSLFLLILLLGFGTFLAVIYCLLSTCLGLEIRRSDIWQAYNPFDSASSIAASRNRRARTTAASAYELDDMDHSYDRLAGGMGGDDMEMMMRRGGPGAKYF